MQSSFGSRDVQLIGETFPDFENEEVRAQPSKVSTSGVALHDSEVHFQKLIITSGADRSIKASGFFGCGWQTGEVFCCKPEPETPSTSLCQSISIKKLVQKSFLGTDIMKSTYRVLSIFTNIISGEVVYRLGSAVALSHTILVTAAHNLHFNRSAADGSFIKWKLTTLKVYADEYGFIDKVKRHGYLCQVLGSGIPTPRWGGFKECPATGEDIAFLKVEVPMPIFALPCSPALDVDVICYGYMGAFAYSKKARAELKTTGESDLWQAYWRRLSNNLESLIEESKGNYAQAEMKAKDGLLKEILSVLWGIPEGAETVTPGVVEATTAGFIAHSCSSLPGISGGALCPMDLSGYIIGCQSGALEGNQNFATSTDNPAFVRQWFNFVLPSLPAPLCQIFQRSDLDMAPFTQWMVKHQSYFDVSSQWLPSLPLHLLEQRLQLELQNRQPLPEVASERESKRRKLN